MLRISTRRTRGRSCSADGAGGDCLMRHPKRRTCTRQPVPSLSCLWRAGVAVQALAQSVHGEQQMDQSQADEEQQQQQQQRQVVEISVCCRAPGRGDGRCDEVCDAESDGVVPVATMTSPITKTAATATAAAAAGGETDHMSEAPFPAVTVGPSAIAATVAVADASAGSVAAGNTLPKSVAESDVLLEEQPQLEQSQQMPHEGFSAGGPCRELSQKHSEGSAALMAVKIAEAVTIASSDATACSDPSYGQHPQSELMEGDREERQRRIIAKHPREHSSEGSCASGKSAGNRSVRLEASGSARFSGLCEGSRRTAVHYHKSETGIMESDSSGAKAGVSPSYDCSKSTEENYRVDRLNFAPRLHEARSLLDYNYHGNYSLARQEVQDDIIQDALRRNTPRTMERPWAVFTAGAMGAGKSHVMQLLTDRGIFPMESFVQVDPDRLRRELPEMQAYVRRDPVTAGTLTHKEAGLMAEILEETALLEGRNVLVDGSMRDGKWYASHITDLRKRFPRLRVAVIHVWAPEEEVQARAAYRGALTGRIIPPAILHDTLRAIPKSVEVVAPLADYCVRIDNVGGYHARPTAQDGHEIGSDGTTSTTDASSSSSSSSSSSTPSVSDVSVCSSWRDPEVDLADSIHGDRCSGDENMHNSHDCIDLDVVKALKCAPQGQSCAGVDDVVVGGVDASLSHMEIRQESEGVKSEIGIVAGFPRLPEVCTDQPGIGAVTDNDKVLNVDASLEALRSPAPCPFPVLATHGETWETFRRTFSEGLAQDR